MENLHGYTPIPPADASCVIANLFTELDLPCGSCRSDVIEISGTAYDGSHVRVTVKGEEVRYYGPVEALERIRARYCPRKPTV